MLNRIGGAPCANSSLPCAPPNRPGREAARTVAAHPEQGWSLLCNGVVVFDDLGELLPGGRAVGPTRQPAAALPAVA